MRIKLYGIFTLVLWTLTLSAQVEPALPNTSSIITCFPDTTGYDYITVGPGKDYSDLQLAINDAQPGSILLLDAGSIFYGGFSLPDKGAGDEWIIIMSSRMDLLPPESTRIDPVDSTGSFNFPVQANAMPKIITNHLAGIPAIRTMANAHHYRFVGIEISVDVNVMNSYGLINLGDGSSAQNTLDKVPYQLIIDRCFIHGHTNAEIMKFGVRLDCADGAIIDSYISDFHSIGFDAQAIAGFNGPGPFKIINNYLEGAGENVIFGGAAPSIPGLVPSDIEITQNHFYKPWSWRVGHPEYAGKHWTIKNLFELKTGKRVLLEGNILENSWADLPIGQSGAAILLTIRTEGGASPQADVSDITIRNNIIRHVGSGISLPGSDDGIGNRSARIKICNNLFEDVNGPLYGDLNIDGPNDGTFLKIGKPRDVWIDHNTILQTGPITWAFGVTDNFIFTNNLVQSFVSTGGYQGIYGPGQMQGNATFMTYFPDVTDTNQHFHQNVLIGGNASKYTNFNNNSKNYFPANVDAVGFSDLANAPLDYHGYALSAGSPFAGLSDDGADIGVDFHELDSALQVDRDCTSIPTYVTGEDEKSTDFLIIPNPAHGDFRISTNLEYFRKFNLTITSTDGRILMRKMITKDDYVSLPALPSGVYFVHIHHDGTSVVKKLFLE